MSHTFRCDNCDIVITEAISNAEWIFPVVVDGYRFGRRQVFCGPECAVIVLSRACTQLAEKRAAVGQGQAVYGRTTQPWAERLP